MAYIKRFQLPRMKIKESLLDLDLIQTYANYLAKGALFADVTAYLGIDRKTAHGWRKKGQEVAKYLNTYKKTEDDYSTNDLLFYRFYMITEQAKAQCKTNLSMTLVDAANDDWKAAAHYLERTDPDNWGKKVDIDKKVSVKKLNIDFTPMTEEALKEDKDVEC
jgi:hypothetical protein